MASLVQSLESALELSAYEAQLYVATIRLGQAHVSDLATETGIPRTAVYPPLKALVRKGLISSRREHGKHTWYTAIEPKYLETLFERKRLDLTEAMRLLGKIQQGGEEITLRYFEGRDGIETASEIFLRESTSKLWRTFENASLMQALSGEYRFEKYVEARVKQGIRARVLLSADKPTMWMQEVMAQSKRHLLDFQLISHTMYPLEASIAVSGEWLFVAVAVRKPFALLVQNRSLATTLASIHDMIWERYTR